MQKVEKLGLQSRVKELYELGENSAEIAKTLQNEGHKIASSSIQRWLARQPGYIPKDERFITPTPVTAPEIEETDPLAASVPEFDSPEAYERWITDTFRAILAETLASALEGLKRCNQGRSRFPIDQIRAIKIVHDTAKLITEDSKHRTRHILDFETALNPDNSQDDTAKLLEQIIADDTDDLI